MKRILSVLLVIALLAVSAVSGIVTVGAESTALVAIMEKCNNWIYGTIGRAPNEWIVNIQDLAFREGTTSATATFTNAIGAVASDRAISFDSEVAEGEKPNYATPCLTFRYLTVAAGSEAYMLYIRTPELYEGASWAVRLNNANIHAVNDDVGKSADINLMGTTLKYLADGSSAWESTTIDDYGSLYLPGGFEGYIKFDISAGIDTFGEEAYKIEYMSFIFAAIGAEYGSFDVGGFYSVTEDSDSAVFNVDGISYNTAAITATTVSLENTTKSITTGISGVAALSGWSLENGSAAAGATKSIVISSNDSSLIGSAAGKNDEIFELTWANIPMTVGVDSIMLYVELPEYANAADWGFKFSGLGLKQAANGFEGYELAYSDPYGMAYSYLSSTDTAWQNGTVSDSLDLGLPSGFKGYVKFDIKQLQAYKDGSIAAKGFDFSSNYQIDYLKFTYNAVGGECGDLVIGEKLYALTSNSYSTVLDIGGTAYELTFDMSPMVANAYNADFGAKEISNLASNAVTTTQTYSSVCPALGGIQALGFTSLTDEAASYYSNANDYYSATWPGIVVQAGSDEVFMLYVELPEFADDSWGMKFMYLALQQEGSAYADGYNMVWVNTVGAKVAYMSIYDDSWCDDVIASDGTFGLPSGFKGYVKLDLKTLTDRTNGTIGSKLDLTKDYKISNVQIGYNNVGGENGDFILGSYYSVINDSDSNMIALNSSEALLSMTSISGDMDCDGIIAANDIAVARKALLGIGIEGAQWQRSDANGDHVFNIKDLVNLKNKCAS